MADRHRRVSDCAKPRELEDGRRMGNLDTAGVEKAHRSS